MADLKEILLQGINQGSRKQDKERMKFILSLLLLTQVGCSFVVTTAGSFVGNLGAELVEEKLKENKCQKDCT